MHGKCATHSQSGVRRAGTGGTGKAVLSPQRARATRPGRRRCKRVRGDRRHRHGGRHGRRRRPRTRNRARQVLGHLAAAPRADRQPLPDHARHRRLDGADAALWQHGPGQPARDPTEVREESRIGLGRRDPPARRCPTYRGQTSDDIADSGNDPPGGKNRQPTLRTGQRGGSCDAGSTSEARWNRIWRRRQSSSMNTIILESDCMSL